jgi:hypothetical protein
MWISKLLFNNLSYNYFMMALIYKILSAILTLFIIIVSYGVISWNIFGLPTFLSGGKDCISAFATPGTAQDAKQFIQEESEKQVGSFFREGSMFGTKCNTN